MRSQIFVTFFFKIRKIKRPEARLRVYGLYSHKRLIWAGNETHERDSGAVYGKNGFDE